MGCKLITLSLCLREDAGAISVSVLWLVSVTYLLRREQEKLEGGQRNLQLHALLRAVQLSAAVMSQLCCQALPGICHVCCSLPVAVMQLPAEEVSWIVYCNT